jgi:adenine deaminase
MTRFDVPPLANVTRELAAVAAERLLPDLVITGGRLLSVYTDRFLPNRELWISQGRIAAVKPAGTCRDSSVAHYDGKGGIIAPGLVDPGHDAHNIIVAGTNEADMRAALKFMKESQGRHLHRSRW